MAVNNIKSGGTNNIGFISTRIAGTDGVSLELEKWADVFKRNGCDCFYFAGELDRDINRSFFCAEAHFKHEAVTQINKRVFGVDKRDLNVSVEIEKLKNKIKSDLYEFNNKFDIHLIIPENALTVPMNLPLGLAITELIAETGIATIAHHHDFYWERERFQINACQDYLNKAFPADLPGLRHVVINSLAGQQLSLRRGISNTVIPNVYDFAKPPKPSSKTNSLRKELGLNDKDLFILQPTRIVPRKWIERSIEIVHHLQLPNPVLVISHASGDEGDEYYERLMEYAATMNVTIAGIGQIVGDDGSKKYTISDVYQAADLITYPSGYEGFGNAFLETVYFKRPIVVNKYPIYVADIEPIGFDVLSIEGFVTSTLIEQIHSLLTDKKRMEATVDKNYQLANSYFSYEVLEEKLMYLVHSISSNY